MHFSITSRLGDVAVICLGGVTDPLTDTFEPYAMGVKRHVAVSPGQLITDVNVLLDIPMTRTFRVYYDDPPAMPGGMGFNYLLVFYDFGADGVFQQDWAAPFAFGDPQVTVTNQPKAFVGTLSDVTFLFLAGVFSATADNTPFTISLHKEVSDLRDDTLLRLDGSTWGVVKSGIKKDVFGMWGTSGSDVFAVGAEGSIYHWDGFGFTQQPVSDVKANLRAVGGSGKTGWAVGDSGTVVRFDDTGWHKADVPAALNRSLTGVSCAAPEDCFAVAWGFAMHWDGKAWTQIQGVPSMELLAVTATGPGEAVAVGSPGQALKLMPSLSLPDSTQIGSRLRAVTVAPDGTVWAAGDNGALVRRTNGYWASVATGTTRPLWAIASSGDRVVAVGDAGTLVRVADNKATSTRVEGYGPHQRAAFGDPDPSGPILAMGISQYLVGPFLPVPEMLNPTENGQLKDLKIQFKTNPGPAAALTYMMIGIPGLFGDTPVWELIQAGDVFETQLPDFEKMEGLPSIPKATLLKLTILRFHKPGLTMDNFDFSDLNQMNAKGWAADVLMFTRP
jgi:photosystem II stability/assembly factor-like uncharacterized protein